MNFIGISKFRNKIFLMMGIICFFMNYGIFLFKNALRYHFNINYKLVKHNE